MSRLNAVAAADDDSNNFNVKVKAKTILTQSTFARHYKRKHKCSSKKEDAETEQKRSGCTSENFSNKHTDENFSRFQSTLSDL